jgi:hypothetical protein
MATECYGCGKPLDPRERAGYYWLGGESRSFCTGRLALPKKPCLNKAFARVVENEDCPVCGEGMGFPVNGMPCDDCKQLLLLGEQTKARTARLETEIVSRVLASFLHRPGFGSGDSEAWPFRIVVRKGEKDYTLASELRRTLVTLWERWGELREARGVVIGSNLLGRLKAGDIGLVEYTEEREEKVERTLSLSDELEELVAEIIEGARKIEDWNEEQS